MEPENMSETVEARLLELLSKINDKLGGIEIGLALQTKMLELHTNSDTANFNLLTESIAEVKRKLEVIEVARAEEAGEKRASRNVAMGWGGGIAALITGLVEVVRQFWPHN